MRTTGDILRAIQGGYVEPVYFLLGEEYYLQHLIIEHIGKAIFGKSKQNKTLLLPDELSNKEIIDQLTQADLFSSKKLFIYEIQQHCEINIEKNYWTTAVIRYKTTI